MKTPLTSLILCLATTVSGQDPLANARTLPVRELTAFKDGHAFVLREDALQKDAEGNVVLDELPTPVLGTFWPFVVGGDAKLISARAGVDEVTVLKEWYFDKIRSRAD